MADYFFYGTLLDPDIRRRVLGRVVSPLRLFPATLVGWRAAYVKGAWYPVLAAAPDEEALGVVLHAVTPAEAAALATYEGPDYDLTAVTVIADGQALSAVVFMAGPSLRAGTETWTLDDWQHRFKPRVLARWR